MSKIHYILFIFLISSSLISCEGEDARGRKPVYVKPSVDKNGRVRKRYVRMPVSTKKNAVRSQNKSKYYYKTREKFRNKSNNKMN